MDNSSRKSFAVPHSKLLPPATKAWIATPTGWASITEELAPRRQTFHLSSQLSGPLQARHRHQISASHPDPVRRGEIADLLLRDTHLLRPMRQALRDEIGFPNSKLADRLLIECWCGCSPNLFRVHLPCLQEC